MTVAGIYFTPRCSLRTPRSLASRETKRPSTDRPGTWVDCPSMGAAEAPGGAKVVVRLTGRTARLLAATCTPWRSRLAVALGLPLILHPGGRSIPAAQDPRRSGPAGEAERGGRWRGADRRRGAGRLPYSSSLAAGPAATFAAAGRAAMAAASASGPRARHSVPMAAVAVAPTR